MKKLLTTLFAIGVLAFGVGAAVACEDCGCADKCKCKKECQCKDCKCDKKCKCGDDCKCEDCKCKKKALKFFKKKCNCKH